MMNRRGFLGGILAAMAAPAIVKAQSLMPVKPPTGWMQSSPGGLLVPEIGRYESVRFIQSPMLVLKDAAGVALCSIAMGQPRVEKFDYGHALGVAMDGGTGVVERTGVAESFELIGVGAAGNMKGLVGPGGLCLDNRHVVTGQNVTVTQMAFLRHGVLPPPEPFDDRSL